MAERVLVVCDDLFFWARIESTARLLGRDAVRVTSEDAMEEAWREGGVGKILADLGARSVDVIGWAPRWKARPDPPTLIGFVSHVHVEAEERARAAGFDSVLPNSRFSRTLAELL